MPLNLSDVTFVIPFRYDSPERLRNLRNVVSYLNHHFETNIIIYEDAPTRMFTDSGKFTYRFFPNNNPLMHRTKMLNDMVKESKTPIVVMYDTDVVLPIKNYLESTILIRNNVFDVIYPYGGRFLNIENPGLISQIILTKDVENIREAECHCIHPNSVGGAIFFNKQKFIEGGMENEYCVSWGFEDTELSTRFPKLGYRVHRVQGPLFHLHHPASTNSANTGHSAFSNNQNEYNKVAGMDPVTLRNYVNTWAWLK